MRSPSIRISIRKLQSEGGTGAGEDRAVRSSTRRPEGRKENLIDTAARAGGSKPSGRDISRKEERKARFVIVTSGGAIGREKVRPCESKSECGRQAGRPPSVDRLTHLLSSYPAGASREKDRAIDCDRCMAWGPVLEGDRIDRYFGRARLSLTAKVALFHIEPL